MKYGIVSDTHSNYHALKAVLAHMESLEVDKKVHCGDIVGYGPKPSETLALTLEHFNYIVMGNHDLAVVDEEEAWGFNPQAKRAIDWTREKMSQDDIDILKSLKYKFLVEDNILFVHGSPEVGNPHTYIMDHVDARMAFAQKTCDFDVAFVGHTHIPFLWHEDSYEKVQFNKSSQISVVDKTISKKAIVNVGAVGQPRDGDPRATYVIYDSETKKVTWYKVPYQVDRTVGLMQRAGFSSNACERLLFGR
jgi:predicted phosphodiesterase